MKSTTIKRGGALILVLGTLTACGSDYGSSAGSRSDDAKAKPASVTGGETLKIRAVEGGGGLTFDRTELSAKPGKVTIALENPGGNAAPHSIAIEGDGVRKVSETAATGASATVTAELEPGTYTFFCTVGGHRDAGMEGTLTVGEGDTAAAKTTAPEPASPGGYGY